MKPLWSWDELCALFPQARSQSALAIVNGVSIDSRTLQSGDLFIAIKGPLMDGHDYVQQACDHGAAAAVVERHVDSISPSFPQIIVEDSLQALYQLATAARARAISTRIVGITGSFGKTSSREALRYILQHFGSVHVTERNFNNHWGAPLTLARLHPESDYAIFEMGMNHAQEISPLSHMIQPHISLITMIGDAHIANLGSREAIADAKAEIFAGMMDGNIVVLNGDDPEYPRLAAAAHQRKLKITSFGHNLQADVRIVQSSFKVNQRHVTININDHHHSFTMDVLGDHWAANMAGVLACAMHLDIDLKAATHHLQSFQPVAGRGLVHKLPYQDDYIYVIDDTYNAGPMAMQSAIRSLGRLTPAHNGRRIAVLGDMVDQIDMIASHQALAPILRDNSIDQVFLYGPHMRHLYDTLPVNHRGGHFDSVQSLIDDFLTRIRPSDCILVKGARGHRAYDGIMQQIVQALQQASMNSSSAQISSSTVSIYERQKS